MNCLNVKPGYLHKYLVSLEKNGKLKAIVTQNIDGLHQKAGSSNVIEVHGTLYKPYIVKSLSDASTNTILEDFQPQAIRTVITKETSDMVKFALESVVANGTGRNAYIENYRVGGKTGTAQKVSNGHYMTGNYIVSFMGFMPADNPSLVIYIAIDNPKGVTQYGGTVAAPVAKSIMESYININKLSPSSDVMPKEYNWMDTKYQVLPNVVGMNLDEAKKSLKGYTLEYSGEGNKVIYESPQGGLYVSDGSTVKLMLGN